MYVIILDMSGKKQKVGTINMSFSVEHEVFTNSEFFGHYRSFCANILSL